MIIVAIYIILSLYFGRKNPLFYLIIIYALQQGPGAFIDQSISLGGKHLLSSQDNFFKDVMFILTSLIAIYFIKIKLPSLEHFGGKMILVYLFYFVFLLAYSFATYYDSNEVFLTGRQLFFLPLSYFLWLAIFSATTREQYEEFLRFLMYVTPISAALYILNSSGTFSIFSKENVYQEIEGDSGSFIRDFATIPNQLNPVLILSVLSLITPIIKIPKWLVYVNLVVLPIAILFTFTRSRLVTCIIQLLILIALYSYFNRTNIMRRIASFVFILVVISIPTYFIAQKFYPAAIEYFSTRLLSAAEEKAADENVSIRAEYFNKAMEITNETSLMIGAGFNRKYYHDLEAVGAWIADSTLPFLMYHTGWLGIILLYLILLFFIIDSFYFFKQKNDWLVAYLASGFVSLFMFSLLMGGGAFTGSIWTFMNFGLYSAIRLNSWRKV